ncbi:NUDIX hydrolase [Kibdelosporangium lantanae]|uniref:NUDIX hydrolase n=1 Tax=Kibdelosporangium lantanae TaxID=1497396 RepID=A0ABW3M5X9_9PSEU
MTRIEHYLNPAAPIPNSIAVTVSVFVPDEQGRVLLVHRADNDLHTLPGGRQEIGETISAAAVRVTRRMAGIDVLVMGLIGVYSDPGHVVEYSDGEVRQEFSVCFRGRPVDGELCGGEGIKEVLWVEQGELEGLIIHPSTRMRIQHGFDNRATPYYSR